VFSSIGFLRIFDQVYNMTSGDPGGPLNATKPLVSDDLSDRVLVLRHGLCGSADRRALPRRCCCVSLLQLRLLRDR
jgi:multiple sugar transport system permease protein